MYFFSKCLLVQFQSPLLSCSVHNSIHQWSKLLKELKWSMSISTFSAASICLCETAFALKDRLAYLSSLKLDKYLIIVS